MSRVRGGEVIPDAIPAELRERRQWVVWNYEERDGKQTKVPYQVGAAPRRAKASDPETWGTFTDAVETVEIGGMAEGIGYVFASDDPYCGVDLDLCLSDGVLHPDAGAIIASLDSYTETSVSGEGAHVILKASVNGGRNRTGKTGWGGDFECYGKSRYFCFTGDHLRGTPTTIEQRQAQLDQVLGLVFPPKKQTAAIPSSPIELDDRELLDRALAARNGLAFERLWNGDSTGYASRSEADLALSGLLAFWTGPDPSRIDSLFRRSGLMREKWNERRGDSTYGAQTIAVALEGRTEFYEPPRPRSSLSSTRSVALDDGDPDDGDHDRGLDDVGNAARFVDQHEPALRYAPAWKTWLVWQGSRWAPDERLEHLRRAKETARLLGDEASSAEDDDSRKAILRHALRSALEPRLRAMAAIAACDPRIVLVPSELDADPWLLNAANGTVDLRDGTLRPHDRSDLLTKVAGANYNPDAPAPTFHAHLERFLPRPELIAFMRRLAGLSAIGVTLEHLLAIFYGIGDNGKSTLLNAIRSALGDYAHHAGVDLLVQHRREAGQATPELADLKGRRLVTVVETRQDGRLAVERVKAITGGDPITARHLHGNPFTFEPSHTVWLATNHKPRVPDDGHAIWRRLFLVPFSVKIPTEEKDDSIGGKLAAERDGILTWIIEGAIEYQRRGLDPPDEVLAATADYKRDEDTFGDFLAERTELDQEASVKASELHGAYRAWADENGATRLSTNALAERLQERGFGRRRLKTGYHWLGLQLVTSNA